MGSIYGDCWHFFRLHQGQKWAWKYIKIVHNSSRSPPDQKLELMMTKLDQNKMKVFDERFSKDGLDCRQVIWIQYIQPVSEVRTGQADAWDEDGRLPLLPQRLLNERDHEGGPGQEVGQLWESRELRERQGSHICDHSCDTTGANSWKYKYLYLILAELQLRQFWDKQLVSRHPTYLPGHFLTGSSTNVCFAKMVTLMISAARDLQPRELPLELLFNRGRTVVNKENIF